MLLKSLICGLLAVSCLGVAASAQAEQTDTKYYCQGKEISLEEAVEITQKYDAVFFDEYHDQTSIHQAEADFFKESLRQNRNMILSLEMFEKDVQPIMDKYLAGEISEEEFTADSRPWNNYKEDYRPLIELAKENNIYVLAGNIPRRIAAQYAKTGDFSLVDGSDRAYLPQKHLVEYGDYYNEFKTYMTSGDETQHMKMTPERIELFYKAQCLKDDVMAASINDYILLHKDTKVLHVQGAFHGDKHLGVVEKLSKLNPALKSVVITPVEAKDYEKVKDEYGKDTILLTFTRK